MSRRFITHCKLFIEVIIHVNSIQYLIIISFHYSIVYQVLTQEVRSIYHASPLASVLQLFMMSWSELEGHTNKRDARWAVRPSMPIAESATAYM